MLRVNVPPPDKGSDEHWRFNQQDQIKRRIIHRVAEIFGGQDELDPIEAYINLPADDSCH
jgi:hypothetical protein